MVVIQTRMERSLWVRARLLAHVEESEYLGMLLVSEGRAGPETDGWMDYCGISRDAAAVMLKRELIVKVSLLNSCKFTG